MTLDVRGKTVVLTGTFSRLKRADAEKQLTRLGAKIGSGVGKSTHVLFAGESPRSRPTAPACCSTRPCRSSPRCSTRPTTRTTC